MTYTSAKLSPHKISLRSLLRGTPITLRGQAPDKTQLTEQGGKLKAERIGAFALARLRIGPDDSAIGIFEVFPRLLPSVIVLPFYNGNT